MGLTWHFDPLQLIYALLGMPVWVLCWWHMRKWKKKAQNVQKIDENAPILLPIYNTLVYWEVTWIIGKFLLFGFLFDHMNFGNRSGSPVRSRTVFHAILYMCLADGASVFVLVLLFSFLISPSAGKFALTTSCRTATKYAILYVFSGTVCITVLAPHYEKTYYIMQTLNPCIVLFFSLLMFDVYLSIQSLRWKGWLYASVWATFFCWLLYTFACLLKVLDGSVAVMTASRYVIAFFYNFIIPVLYYRSLIDDSRYWRNLEKFILPTESFSYGYNSQLLKHDVLGTVTGFGRGGNIRDALANLNISLIDFTQLTTPTTMLGRGGYGVVWKAKYRDELVAVKELHGERLSVDHIKLFFREAMLSAKFDHENILKFYGACIQPPEFLMIFQWCNKGDLGQFLRKSKNQLTFQNRLDMAVQAVNGLLFFHQQGMVHRDLKPPNYLVHEESPGFISVKLADFGSGRSKHDKMPLFQGISPLFAAPEIRSLIPMVLKEKNSLEAARHWNIMYGQEVDIFPLGWVLWAIFVEGDWKQIMKAHNEQVFDGWLPSKEPEKFMTNWPYECQQIVSQCWEEDADLRPSAETIHCKLDELAQRKRLWWDDLEEHRRVEIVSLFSQGVELYDDCFHEEVRKELRTKCGLTEEQCDQIPLIVYNLRKDSNDSTSTNLPSGPGAGASSGYTPYSYV